MPDLKNVPDIPKEVRVKIPRGKKMKTETEDGQVPCPLQVVPVPEEQVLALTELLSSLKKSAPLL